MNELNANASRMNVSHGLHLIPFFGTLFVYKDWSSQRALERFHGERAFYFYNRGIKKEK